MGRKNKILKNHWPCPGSWPLECGLHTSCPSWYWEEVSSWDCFVDFSFSSPSGASVLKLVNFTGFKHIQLIHGNPATSLASLHGQASLEGDLCSASGTCYHLFSVSLCTAFTALHHHLQAGFLRGFPDPLLLWFSFSSSRLLLSVTSSPLTSRGTSMQA